MLKSVTNSVAFIGLCLMLVINFATAEIWVLLIVPICLLPHPLKLDLRVPSLRNFSRVSRNLVLGFMGFPPATFMVSKGAFEGFSSIDVGDFWNWLESLWAWNSAAYLFIDTFYGGNKKRSSMEGIKREVLLAYRKGNCL
ncbi:hypothetical protein FEM48_Zijuj06G0112400 [Ziziphus jujuba var. spinosa]|uniref:Uncharacterized protein n=1 Tax=Ziziphus jujuba var. spinosa TaxID=714518 RepID=A0A978V8Y8_ZIZJJ|nr:hypothetical protein FEM48_Zijuj06G0112400 [Ziziphus jujuba var. spinosa]